MSIFDFMPRKEGDINKGGTVRSPGQEEQNPLEAKGLSQAELAVKEQNEIFNKKELDFLENFLNHENWRAADVLLSEKVKQNIKLPPWFRYGNLDKHLQTLAAKKR
jgi:hypothetical protein